MKTILLLLVLLPFSLMSQKSFAPLHAEWNYEGHDLYCHGNHINYVVEKEEMIDDKDCSVIFAYSSSDLNPNFDKGPDSLIVWEDDNKVYFLEDTTFYLLFNFDNEIGDTITYYEPFNKYHFSSQPYDNTATSPNRHQVIISNISMIQLGTEEFREYEKIYLSDNGQCIDQYPFIENIGSTSQILTGDKACYLADGCFGGLQCYSNGVIDYKTDKYFDTPNPSCDLLDSTEELISYSNLTLFPNPASTELQLRAEEQILQADLINFNGHTVKTFHNTKHLPIEELDPGLYFLRILLEEGYATIKFVKE